MASHRKKHRPRALPISEPGTGPGTLNIDPAWPKPAIHALAYGPARAEESQPAAVAALGAVVADHAVTWINVEGLGDEKTLLELGKQFHLHPLALEDVVNLHQRPKMEKYGEHAFLVLQAPHLEERLATEQHSIFWGPKFVLLFQEGTPGDPFARVRERIRGGVGAIRDQGADYLVYALIDAVVDSYFPVVEQMGDRIEELEEKAFEESGGFSIEAIHLIKRDLLIMRRALWPLNEMLNMLTRDSGPEVGAETRLHLRDCYDHTLRLIELVETYRETCSDLMNLHLTLVSNRTNEIMKVLTIIATIFIPLSFFAGVWGMNFEFMPELKWRWGYAAALAFMGGIGCTQLLFFRRRGWIGPLRLPKFLKFGTPPPEPPYGKGDLISERRA